jgi:hypothetical protein
VVWVTKASRDGFDQGDGVVGELTHGPDHFGMARVPDQDDVQACGVVAFGFHMHLRHQRAGGVDINHLPPFRFRRNRFGYSVGGENHRPVLGAFVQFFDEHGS